MQQLARGVPIAPLVRATQPQDDAAPDVVKRFVSYGASPRGMQAMILAGKIIALLDGRYNVAFDDIRAAATPAMRHRLILNFEAEAEGMSSDKVIGEILKAIEPEKVA